MRTIWNGSLSFGLVNIPIGLALATQRDDVSFRTLHRECGTPIKQKRWCPFHERDVEPEELVKGWEVAKGEFVIVEESDLEAGALPRSESVANLPLVQAADVGPMDVRQADDPAPGSAAGPRARPRLPLRARPERQPETAVSDLMEALRRSVGEVQDRKSSGAAAKSAQKTKATPSGGGSRSRRAPARKSA